MKITLKFKCEDLFIPLIALFAVDFLDLSGVLLSLTLMLLFAFYGKNVKLDNASLLLMLFSAAYAITVFYYEGFSIDRFIKFLIAPWGSYVLGYNLPRMKEGLTPEKLAGTLFFFFYVHGMLNLWASIQQYGIDFNGVFRLAYDFWQNRNISVTTAALYYSPFVLLSIGTLFTRCKWSKKFAALLFVALGFFATILYQNRTLAVAGLILVAAGVISFFRDENIRKNVRRNSIIALIAFLAITGVLLLTDVAGFRTFIKGTAFFGRLTGEGDSRFKTWESFVFGEAWKYPFGGNRAVLYRNGQYVHNMWLDVFRRTGILPFFLITIFTIMAFKIVSRYQKECRRRLDADTTALPLAMLGVFCLFCVEPIIEANPYLFYLPLIVIGAMKSSIHFITSEMKDAV